MIRVWVDAALEDARLRSLSASALDWGRRRMVRVLGGRGFGDVDVEAVVMVALLGAFGAQPRGAGRRRRGGAHRRAGAAAAGVGVGSQESPRVRRSLMLHPQVNGHFFRRARGRPHR